MGEVAKSAEMAREMGYLRQSDRIVLNRFELLHIAKEEARALNATAYRPPLHQRQIAGRRSHRHRHLQGRDDQHAAKAASSPSTTTTSAAASPKPCAAAMWKRAAWWMRQWLLDLERKNFMELLAHRQDAGPHRTHAEERQATAQLRRRT